MKFNINKNMLRRGIFLAGISLITISFDGCSKERQITNFEVMDTELDNDNKLVIESAEDTQIVLNIYNHKLKNTKLTIDDIEYMSHDLIYSIKLEDGGYSQLDLDNYNITFANSNNPIIYKNNTDLQKYNILTGKKITQDILDYDNSTVREYVRNNNINISAYTFQRNIGWDDSKAESIIKKYGQEVFECIKEYGLPFKMYDINQFTKKAKSIVKK